MSANKSSCSLKREVQITLENQSEVRRSPGAQTGPPPSPDPVMRKKNENRLLYDESKNKNQKEEVVCEDSKVCPPPSEELF